MKVIGLHFSQFMDAHCKKGDKFLLALSGGPDSTALFQLLLESKISFEVAHVDHGWRPESADEAEALEKMCRQCGVSFHLRTIKPTKNNLENLAREERHAFFKEVVERGALQGVLLGHHADDLAETVLKRVFEGAHLYNLKGPQPQVVLEGVTYLRPLLKVRKKQILAFLEEKGVSFLLDPTNDDPHFLRGRFRRQILPQLALHFGKEITPSLCRLSQYAVELEEFVASFLAQQRTKIRVENGHVTLHLEDTNYTTEFEWKAVIKNFFDSQGITISNALLETVVYHLKRKGAAKKIMIGKKEVQIKASQLTLFL